MIYARGTNTTPPVDPVGQALVNILTTQLAPRSLAIYGVDYPATLDLAGSTPQGSAVAWQYIQNQVAACPATRLVLSGYSQGANVIDALTADSGTALTVPTPMPAATAAHVAAVVLFGDPSRKVGGGPLTGRSSLYGAKTIDLCMPGDPICSWGTDLLAHGRYIDSGTVAQGAQFAASRVVQTTG
ncbi:putative cutinase [Mycolicibacterium anyangense]|uniref:Cutinase n=1 Tax=Mycolicibacterium anyangense TaxID=1431246 RepID=A0A6N4WCS7_9MYCO|nr:putative cutinase [Mycolicibacterium anyangense]